MSTFKDRQESEARAAVRITNEDLVCRDCIYKLDDSVILGNTSRCKRYPWKPDKVSLGGECDEYKAKR